MSSSSDLPSLPDIPKSSSPLLPPPPPSKHIPDSLSLLPPSPLHDESLPLTPTSPLADPTRKKANPLVDLIDTEKNYVENLTGVIRKVAAAWSRSNLPPPDLDIMFRSIEGVYKANRSLHMKLKDIGANPSNPKALGDLLMRWIDDLEGPYTAYCTKYRCGFDNWLPVQSNPKLNGILQSFSQSNPPPSSEFWTLDSLFLLPKARLKYYKKLYNRLLKSTAPGRSDHRLLIGALETLDKLLGILDSRSSFRVSQEFTSFPPPVETEDEVVIDMRAERQTSLPPADVRSPVYTPLRTSIGEQQTSSSAGSARESSASAGERLSRETDSTSISRTSRNTMSMPIADLERRLITKRTLDIFTMQPKTVRLQMNPPSLTFTRQLRCSMDVIISFTPKATGVEVVHRLGHIFLLSDLFLICERMTPEERSQSPEGGDMWLCYPPLAGKVLRVSEVNGQDNALQVAIMRKETLILRAESMDARNFLISEFRGCIEFAGSLPPPSKQPPPPMPPLPNAHSGPSRAERAPSPGSLPNSIPGTPSSSMNVLPPRPMEQPGRPLDGPPRMFSPTGQMRGGPSMRDLPPMPPGAMPPNVMPPNGMPPGRMPPNGLPGVPNGILPNGPPPNGLPPKGLPHNGPPYNGPPPNGMLSNGGSPNSMSPNEMLPNVMPPNGNVPNGMSPNGMPPTGPPGQGMPPRGPMNGPYPPGSPNLGPMRNGGPPFNANGDGPPQPLQNRSGPPNMGFPQRNLSLGPSPGPNYPPRPPSEPQLHNGVRKAPSTRSLSSHHDQGGIAPPMPPFQGGYPPNGNNFISRTNSYADDLRAPQPRTLLPSAQMGSRAMSLASNAFDDLSPPSSPVQENMQTGPVTSTMSANMKCKIFLQQQHAQWKSLGAARLKLYRQDPTNVKQLVVEAENKDKTMLISTIVLTDGVERVGKTGVAIELSDKGSRTGIVYMIQLRSETSAGGLFDSLLAGSDRAR